MEDKELCFYEVTEELTKYELAMEALYKLTGMCHCNLCRALKINGWKNREDTKHEGD